MSLKGQAGASGQRPKRLRVLPRPLYGQIDSLANTALAYRHKHPWHQLAYAAEGVLQVRTARCWYVAPPKRAIWIPACVVHRVFRQRDTVLRSLYIEHTIPGWAHDRCRVLSVSALLRELIRAFGRLPIEYDQTGSDGRLAEVLLDQLSFAADVGLSLPLPVDERLRQVCGVLQDHPDSREGLTHFSERLGVSSKSLSRLFVRDTGLSFRAWRQRMRLLKALPALQRGETVTRVALDNGYDSVSAFIAAFARQFGASPKAFLGGDGPGALRS